jgi:hypothetical protein
LRSVYANYQQQTGLHSVHNLLPVLLLIEHWLLRFLTAVVERGIQFPDDLIIVPFFGTNNEIDYIASGKHMTLFLVDQQYFRNHE